MRKREGGYTYFLPDVAYHLNKWQRGFVRVINEQGADHHSTVTRVRAGLQALEQDIPKGWPEYVLHQMVTVMREGEEVKLSKRAGSYVTLRDLIDEVGRDATRYFLVARAPNSQLIFDIDLALSQSNDNPVYYIQYAHARTCSVLRKLIEQGWEWQVEDAVQHLDQLQEEHEKSLLRRLDRYPEVVATAALNNEPHTVATYLRELAGDFHTWYNAHKMLVDRSSAARCADCPQPGRGTGNRQWTWLAGRIRPGGNVNVPQDFAKLKRDTSSRKAGVEKAQARRNTGNNQPRGNGFRPYLAGVLTGVFLSFLVYLGTLPNPADPALETGSSPPAAEIPKPRFDFYTLLPKQTLDEEKKPDAVEPAADVSKPPAASSAPEPYLAASRRFPAA